MGIDQVHDIILQFLAKEKNGEATHEEIDRFLNRASYAHFNDLYNNPQRWRVDRQIGQIYYGGSQRINDALAPFKKLQSFVAGDNPGGLLTLNTNFLHLVSLAATVYNNTLSRNVYYPIQVVNEEELIDRLESQVSPVGATNPIAIMNDRQDGVFQIQMFPEQAHTGRLYYFSKPVECEFVYTQSGRVITFDEDNSVDLEWNDLETYNIITLALSYFSIPLASADVANWAEAKQKDGQ